VIVAAALSLFCAHGGVGLVPDPLPSGYETQFAVAVVEIESPAIAKNVSISGFTLYDKTGVATKMKRVVKAETFDEPSVAGQGFAAYYLNTAGKSRSKPWDGTLPAGKTRLRVRVALENDPIAAVRYTLDLGSYAISGPCDIEWPT